MKPGRLAAALTAAIWLSAHALALTRVPPMHADEAWLASETRSILAARSAAATADFLHLTPRAPHAIRLLFHALQAPFVAASWSLASVRLLSLACGLGVVVLAAGLAARLLRCGAARLLLVGGLALDPQLWVSSHFARPEIVLVLAFMAALVIRVRRPLPGLWTEALAGSVLGLSVGLHANSLLPCLALGALYALDALRGPDRRPALRRLLVLIAVTAFWALLWVGASRLLSPEFPRAYGEFGRRYGVGESLLVKLLRLPGFYWRLCHRIAGTYFVPQMRPTLLLFAAAAAAGLLLAGARALWPRRAPAARVGEPLAVLLAVNLGLVAIGKFSQPSAVLLMPGGYWLAAAVLQSLAGSEGGRQPGQRLRQSAALAAAAIVVAALGFCTASQGIPWLGVSYGRYLQRIRAHVPEDAPVLAGLNTAFAFAPGRLHAFNDLDSLQARALSFQQYVQRYSIRFILYPSELDRIYAERPLWNDLYGNLAPYYLDMKRFLAERCEVLAGWEEPVFALRIVPYQGRFPARLTIYRVLASGP